MLQVKTESRTEMTHAGQKEHKEQTPREEAAQLVVKHGPKSRGKKRRE
jgi:hypothetical protein